jgi:hypothetical protein
MPDLAAGTHTFFFSPAPEMEYKPFYQAAVCEKWNMKIESVFK